jgi:hypothetical protein
MRDYDWEEYLHAPVTDGLRYQDVYTYDEFRRLSTNGTRLLVVDKEK